LVITAQCDLIRVVLVSPRNPLNIGAAARAMANFGLSQLRVVAPYDPHWREAQSAVGAEDLLRRAETFRALDEAVTDCTLVIGTATIAQRKPEQPVVRLPDLSPYLEKAYAENASIAFVFGPEKHGLTREDLSYCHLLAEIPTDQRQPSMNLGQAVAVCLYEVSVRSSASVESAALPGLQLAKATSGDLDLLAEVIDRICVAADYSPRTMQEANRHDLRLLLRRFALNEPDARRALGFFRKILWRLEHPEPHTKPGNRPTEKC
jgi:TrmH family RNA methyltransferase